MNFSIEITMKTDLLELPKVKDVYITMLPGNDYREVATKACELVKSGFETLDISRIEIWKYASSFVSNHPIFGSGSRAFVDNEIRPRSASKSIIITFI